MRCSKGLYIDRPAPNHSSTMRTVLVAKSTDMHAGVTLSWFALTYPHA